MDWHNIQILPTDPENLLPGREMTARTTPMVGENYSETER